MRFGILAGGEGSRMAIEGVSVPKALIPLSGTPAIHRLINIFENCGAESISIFVNRNLPDIPDYLEKIAPLISCPLEILRGSTPSSFHSFARLVEFMKPEEKFIITTVDTIFLENKFKEMVRYFQESPCYVDGVLGVTTLEDDEKPLYVSVDNDLRITDFFNSRVSESLYISAGIYGLTPSCLPVIEKAQKEKVSRMRNFQSMMVREGQRLQAFDLGEVIDMDHKGDITKAETLLSGEEKKIGNTREIKKYKNFIS